MKHIQLIIALSIFFFPAVFGQTNSPIIAFPLKGLSAEFQKEVNNTKPRIFFIFSSSCSGAYNSLPRLKALQDSVGDELQIALIGKNNYKTQTDYRNYNAFYHYNFPVTFDSAIFKILRIKVDPAIVWVNSQGDIISQTGTVEINPENLSQFIQSGIPPKLHNNQKLSPTKTIYLSKLSEAPEDALFDAPIKVDQKFTSFQAQGTTAEQLFQLAFLKRIFLGYEDSLYEKIETTPVLENFSSADSAMIQKKYNYALGCTDTNQLDITEWMQQDLQRLFTCEARIETREVPYWALIVLNDDTAKVATKYKSTSGVASNTEIKVKNCERYNLLVQLRRFFPFDPVFIDETNMKGNIDISIEGVLSDFPTLKMQLNKNGFDIVIREKPTLVLVLTPKNKSVTRR